MALAKSNEAQEKIDYLIRLKQALDTMMNQCKGTGYPIKKCSIIDTLYTLGLLESIPLRPSCQASSCIRHQAVMRLASTVSD